MQLWLLLLLLSNTRSLLEFFGNKKDNKITLRRKTKNFMK